MEIRFSDTYAPEKGDIYKTLEVEVTVPLDAAFTESDIPAMARELAHTQLKKEAATLATADNLDIILANVQIRRRGDTGIYDATAEAYMHATPQKPATSRSVKKT